MLKLSILFGPEEKLEYLQSFPSVSHRSLMLSDISERRINIGS